MENLTINELIAQEREKKNLSFSELVQLTDIMYIELYRIEQGIIKHPHVKTLYKLAMAFDCNFAEMLISAGYISPTEPDQVGEFIYRTRLLENMTLNELAQKANISSSILQSIEKGKRKPTLQHLKKLTNAFKIVSFAELMLKAGYDLSESNLSELVVKARKKASLSQIELAEKSTVNIKTIKTIESGERIPQKLTWSKLCLVLDLDQTLIS